MELTGTKREGFYTYDTRLMFAVAQGFAVMNGVTLQEAIAETLSANGLRCTPMGVIVELIGDTTLEFATRDLLWNG